jgi:hypothetical protein
LSGLGARLQEPLRQVFARWAEASPFVGSLDLPGRTRLLPVGMPAAAVGAAMLGTAAESA